MGSPLSPIMANPFMEKFENKALDTFPLKPKFWIKFLNDTSVYWPHGDEELKNFLNHLNSISDDIKLKMAFEENYCITFFDILLIRSKDGSLGHTMFRKKAHTDNYLDVDSHHHLAKKMGVLQSLFTRACRISDEIHTEEKATYLRKIFINLGYNKKDIFKAIRKSRSERKKDQSNNPQTANAYLPYIQGVTEKLANALMKRYIKTSFKLMATIKQRMKLVKDNLEHLQQKAVYMINCSCGE